MSLSIHEGRYIAVAPSSRLYVNHNENAPVAAAHFGRSRQGMPRFCGPLRICSLPKFDFSIRRQQKNTHKEMKVITPDSHDSTTSAYESFLCKCGKDLRLKYQHPHYYMELILSNSNNEQQRVLNGLDRNLRQKNKKR